EDPLPAYISGAVGTGQPRRSRNMGMGMFQPQQPEPKGDIKKLWDLLGVELVRKSTRGFFNEMDDDYAVVWQDFKPGKFSGLEQLTSEYVFISHDTPGAENPFNEKEGASAGLQQLILPLPGGIVKRNAASTE